MARRKKDENTKDLFAFADDNLRPTLVYIAINVVNGKRYIGLTRLTLDKRRAAHISHANRRTSSARGQYFYTAMRKYGPSVFMFSVLETCASYKDACAAERRLISELRPEYNLTAGGEGIVGYRHTPSSKRKMASAKAGTPPAWTRSEKAGEIKQKLVQKLRGRKVNLTSEHIDFVANVLSKRANDARRRPVLCATDGLAFRGATDAEAYYGLGKGLVTLYCRGSEHKFKPDRFGRMGLVFFYVDDAYSEQLS